MRPLSEKLVAELTAYLRSELAKHLETASLALVHAPALDTFFKGGAWTYLEIAPEMAWLSGHASGIEDSIAENQTAEQLLSTEGLPAAAGLLRASSSACILGPMRIVDRVKCSSRGTIRRTTWSGPSDGV